MLAEAGIESVKLPPRSPNLRLRRALRENHKGRLFGSNDFLWRRFVAERRPRIYGALSPGTKSSRTRKPAHHSDRRVSTLQETQSVGKGLADCSTTTTGQRHNVPPAEHRSN